LILSENIATFCPRSNF